MRVCSKNHALAFHYVFHDGRGGTSEYKVCNRCSKKDCFADPISKNPLEAIQ